MVALLTHVSYIKVFCEKNYHILLKYLISSADDLAHCIKVLTTKPDDQNLTSRTCIMGGENEIQLQIAF